MNFKSLIVFITTHTLYTSCSETSNNIQPIPEKETAQIPHFYIETEGKAYIASKENYINGTLSIDGGNE